MFGSFFNKPTQNHTPSDPESPLIVIVDKLENAQSPVFIALYTPSNKFGHDRDIFYAEIVQPQNEKKVQLTIQGIPYGTYAIGAFQDLNGSRILDKNFLGIPTKPYGFSNNVKPRFGPPTFHECKFVYNNENRWIHIRLIRGLG